MLESITTLKLGEFNLETETSSFRHAAKKHIDEYFMNYLQSFRLNHTLHIYILIKHS